MKRMTVLLAVAAFMLFVPAVAPASAQVVKDSSCNDHGLTWDCHFHIKDMVVGQPVTFQINYSCPNEGDCGPVTSFGLGEKGFYPASDVAGHLVGGARLATGLQLTFVFDALENTGNHSKGTANFIMNLMMADGSGGMVSMPCPVEVRLKSEKN
jgi:hypothetical protein